LKRGDWVIYKRGSQAVGEVESINGNAVYINEVGYTSIIQHKDEVTVVPKEVADIFIAVHFNL
jgi:hypothetical protein